MNKAIMGRYIPTDELYPGNTLIIVQGVKKWLDGNADDGSSVEKFQEVLMEMATEKPFDPASRAVRYGGEMPLRLPPGDDGFRHRRPVWQLIADGLEIKNATGPVTFKMKADLLGEQFDLYNKYLKYEAALATFRGAVLNLNLTFREAPYEGFIEDDVFVDDGVLKEKGENARELIRKVIEDLIPDLQEHIQKNKNA